MARLKSGALESEQFVWIHTKLFPLRRDLHDEHELGFSHLTHNAEGQRAPKAIRCNDRLKRDSA